MQFAMEEIIEGFTAETGISCHLVISSSGKLTAQITEGAPYDILVSADMKYPGQLHAAGFTLGPPVIYAYGKLVLWTTQPEIEPDVKVLGSHEIRYIALANPNTAPYGAAALEVLQHHNLDVALKEKLVFGESIGQVNQFISSGSAEIGFTALSVVSAPRFEGMGRWKALDTALYSPIEQGVVVIRKEDSTQQDALLFRDFLSSDQAKQILVKYGYAIDEQV
jgi:molybdate transport system substrate-binding protein